MDCNFMVENSALDIYEGLNSWSGLPFLYEERWLKCRS